MRTGRSTHAQGQVDTLEPLRFGFEIGLGQRVGCQPAIGELNFQAVFAGRELHLWHVLGAADVVEEDGEAQQHAQAYQLDAFLAKLGELVPGDIAPVAAHQQREHLLVLAREAGQVRVFDQVGAVLVILVVGDVQAHFVHLGAPAQQFSVPVVVKAPVGCDLVQRRQRLGLHPCRLVGIDVIALHERCQGE